MRRGLLLIGVLLAVGGAIGYLLSSRTAETRTDGLGAGQPERVVVGRGAQAASIWRLRGAGPGPVVVFMHGWGLDGPQAYRPWLEHLARRGNIVIVPRYQTSLRTRPDRALRNSAAGLRAALRRVQPNRRRVVFVGHSAGGALAVDLAASARRIGLPVPRGMLVVYPGRAIRNFDGGIPVQDLSGVAPTTRTVILASALDRVVGDGPARQLGDTLTANGLTDLELVAVRDPVVAEHFAPARAGSPARRLFWRRLDRLIGPVDEAVAPDRGGDDDRPS